jgi:hypothetical protein
MMERLPGELAAIAVEGGNASQGDEAVAVEMLDFRQIGQKSPCGDFAHALDGLDEL